MSTQRWKRRLAGAAVGVLTAVTALLMTGTGVAGAAPGGPPPADSPDNHQMGASVLAHDGTTNQPPIMFAATTPGIDVSSYQGNVNWSSYYQQGKRFAYVKATEGTSYQNPYFSQQYGGSYNVGMIRGAYHYARPDSSGGAAQADYFVAHGGGWSKDGKTLPGTLDIEWGPSSDCYGLSQAAMVSWISAFSNEYHAKTTRWPVIYTATSWWTECTGNKGSFSANNPLWVARYASAPGTLPYNWGYYTIWQYSSSPIDQDYFNGDLNRVKALATG